MLACALARAWARRRSSRPSKKALNLRMDDRAEEPKICRVVNYLGIIYDQPHQSTMKLPKKS